MLIRIIFLFILALVSQGLAYGNTGVISSVEIVGNIRLEKETIQNYLLLHKGQIYNQNLADQSIKKIFESGYFSDVSIKIENGKMLVLLKENPIINKVTFEGNRKVTKKSIISELSLKSQSIYSKYQLQQEVNKITEIYNHMGFYNVSVDPKIIELENNKINLIYVINEGRKTLVRDIYFIGNKNFKDNDLKSVLSTKESKWYRFWGNEDSYNPDRLEYDKELLRLYYLANGFYDIKIISVSSELSPDKDAFIITYSLDEGEVYNFGKIDLKTKLAGDIENLKKNIYIKSGEKFNNELIEFSSENLVKAFNNKSFAFVKVEPLYVRKPKEKIVDVTFLVQEGAKAYINKINILGNLRTKDNVIRREMGISEGDPFNVNSIEKAEQSVKDLNYFSSVEVDRYLSDSGPNLVDLDVKVKEQSTTKINIGGGVSTESGGKGISPVIELGYNEDNLFGEGNKLSISLNAKNKRHNNFSISYTNPYFMDKNLSHTVSLTMVNAGKSNSMIQLPYSNRVVGASTGIAYKINNNLTHEISYGVFNNKISNISENSSILIKSQKGHNLTSSISQSFIYSMLNSSYRPTKGYLLNLGQTIAGVGGGSAKYVSHEFSAHYYKPIFKTGLLFSVNGATGYSFDYGKGNKVIPTQGFNLGGLSSVRGFSSSGIGPREKRHSTEAVKGNFYYRASLELKAPIKILPKEFDVEGILFLDAGSLQNAAVPSKYKDIIDEYKQIRVSAGLGVKWYSDVLGAVSIYIPRVLKKSKNDIVQDFHIDFMSMSF